jgi:hypothetical protein
MMLANNISYKNGTMTASPLIHAYFGNCIVNGNGDDEIEQDSMSGIAFNFTFDHCLVQTSLASQHQSSFIESVINKDPKFKDPWNGKFELDTLSPAKDVGALSIITNSSASWPLWPIKNDLKGNSRELDAGPDLGVYERIEH